MASYTNNPGRTGLNESQGIIFEEFLPELRGREWYKKADEMRKNCPVIAGALLAMEMPLRDIDFYWESDLGPDDPRLQLLEESEKNMRHTLFDHITESLSMLWAGYSIFAVWYERVNGRVLWRKFLPLGQDTIYRWDIDEEGGINGVWQYPHVYKDEIPIDRAILYRTRVERNNPEGWSLLRQAYVPYYYWKNLAQIEGIALERGGAGYPVVTAPQGADLTPSTSESTDYGRAHAMVRNVRMDEQGGVIVPFGWEFRFEQPNQGQPPNFDTVIRRYESRMMLAMMTQFLMLGQDNTGTQALSSDQTDFYTQALNAIADIVSDTFTRHAIPKLMLLNGQAPDGLRLAHSPAGDIDLNLMADFLQKVGDKVTWTTEDEVWIRSLSRLPEKEAGELERIRAEEMERKQAAAQAFLPRTQPNRNQPDPNQDDDEDEDMPPNNMVAQIARFVSDNAPDDRKRRKLEKELDNSLNTFFKKQQARLIKAARSLKR